jgi:hypothetical protein
MNKFETQNLAEKIARLLQTETQSADFYSLQTSIEKINQRLDRIESQIAFQNTNPKSKIQNPKSFHSSQEKFDVAEIVAGDATENFGIEKACSYEPTGKPCDHCAMCSSRGF